MRGQNVSAVCLVHTCKQQLVFISTKHRVGLSLSVSLLLVRIRLVCHWIACQEY
jgi:hypothetical protein